MSDSIAEQVVEACRTYNRVHPKPLGNSIAHESHRRDGVLLTLKQCGHPVPKEIRDGIWAWNQI